VNKYLRTVASVGFLFTFNTAFFRRLLLAHVKVPWLHKEICRQQDSNQRSLFPKATPSTRIACAMSADNKNEVPGCLIQP